MVKERLKLDFPVAKHIGIGCPPGAVFGEEVGEDPVPVLGCEVRRVQPDSQVFGDGAGIGQVGGGRAVIGVVVLLPVLHEEPVDVIALLEEPQGRDGRVNPAGEADDDGLAGGRSVLGVRGRGHRSGVRLLIGSGGSAGVPRRRSVRILG